jgi:hypothetical protein
LTRGTLVVDPDFQNGVSEEVSDGAEDGAQLAMDQAWSARPVGHILDADPHLHQVVSIGFEFGRSLVFTGGANDPTARSFEALDELSQSCPLLIISDPARHSMVAHVWQVDEKTSGKADMGC